MHSAVQELAKQQILPMTVNELTRDVVASYKQYYIARRLKFQEFFEKARENVLTIDQRMLELFQLHQLWIGREMSHEWRSTLGRFLGCADAKLAAMYGINVPRSMPYFFVCPFYDVPGHIVSLLLIGTRGMQREHIWQHQTDDGLMMLDATGLEDDIIIALNDPLLALQIQRRNFICNTKPLKIIVYGSNTENAWMSIYARRVIFWDHDTNFLMMSQAKKHVRSWIATQPSFECTPFEYLTRTTIPMVVTQLTENVITWPEALKKFILTHKDQGEVYSMVKNLDMTAYDMNRVYELCSNTERMHVNRVIGEKPIEHAIYINKRRVIEADGAWWFMRGGHRELLCNAIIRIERAVHAQDSGIDHYEGTISANGKTIRFQDKIEFVEKNPRAWLSKAMMAGGLGVPALARALMGQSIIEIAKQFSPPIYARGYSRIGWYPDQQAFIFPNFSIREGRLDDSLYAMGTQLPASNITPEPLSHGDWDAATENTEANAVLWAGLACFMSNLIAPVIDAEAAPIAFVGGMGSIAYIVSQHLAKELDAPVYTSSNNYPSRKVYRWPNVQKESMQVGYPGWIDFESDPDSIKRITAKDRANIFTRLPLQHVRSLEVGNTWVFIRGLGRFERKIELPKLRGFMRYVAWLQGRNFALEPASNLQASILESLRLWADEEMRAIDLAVFDAAAKVLNTPDTRQIDHKLIHLVFTLREEHKLRVTHEEFYDEFQQRGAVSPPTKDTFVAIDDNAHKIFINEAILTKALKHHPRPDLEAAIREMASNGEKNGFEPANNGFVMRLQHWETEIRKWRRTKA